MSRAENRHYSARERERVRRIIRDVWRDPQRANDRKFIARWARAYPCSCPMCGNPRRHFGQRTLQEIRQESKWPRQFTRV